MLLETNHAFRIVTQTYFNSEHMIDFCVVKVFMVLLETKKEFLNSSNEVLSSTISKHSLVLNKSHEFGNFYRTLHNRNQGNSMTKSRIESPCVWQEKASHLTEDKIYTRHCSKQTSRLTTSKHPFELTFLYIYN